MSIKYVFLAVALCVVAGLFAGYRWLHAIPEVRAFDPPAKTAWVPEGASKVGRYDYTVIPEPDAFHTMHVGVNNTDELWTVAAPMVEHAWTAETDLYVAEGPTFDNEGNLYFSPYNPREDVSLVSLDRETGKRRWVVPGHGAGSGAILILNDPDRTGRMLIYHSTYTTAMALRPDGSVVWEAPTGLRLPELRPGERDYTHAWGMNYHPQADAVFGVTMDGYVYAHDRRTGRPLLSQPLQLPGAPAVIAPRPPAWISSLANEETDAVFGRTIDDMGLFTAIVDVIFGSGFSIANFYGIDPNSGRIYIAATAPDEQDGAADGVSQNGAIYLLELTGQGPDDYKLTVVRYFPFEGGTGSTPTINRNSDRVMVADDNGNVIALDGELNELWRIDVGPQVVASVAVASDNDEIYVVTKYDVIKLIDRGDSGEIAWRATLDAYPGFDNFNALTPTITANGLAVAVGAGREIQGQHIMSKVGVGLLDRESGELRSFAEGREESIAVTVIGPDGGFYIANSPVRRAIARGLLGDELPPLVGGIQRYEPVRVDLLVRDATCAAAARAKNADSIAASHPESARDDLRRIRALIRQSRNALPRARNNGELSPEIEAAISVGLDAAEANASITGLARVADALTPVCGLFK